MTRLLSLLLLLPGLALGETKVKDQMVDPSPNARRCGPSQCPIRTDAGWDCLTVMTNPATPASMQKLAVPDCQGSACMTEGGRGGVIYTVNTLAEGTTSTCVIANGVTTGTCSLRDCINAAGPRNCVLTVGGTSTLVTALSVLNPNVTVIGQTAPGGGFQLSGKGMRYNVWHIRTHDVVLSYFRNRKGYGAGSLSNGDTIGLAGYGSANSVYNVLLWHLSIQWSQDENLDIYSAPRDVTVSHTLISDPLAGIVPGSEHPFNAAIGASTTALADVQTNVDFVRSGLFDFGERGPQITNRSFRMVNTLVYNWDSHGTLVSGGVQADFRYNIWKRGPMSPTGGSNRGNYEVQVFPAGVTNQHPSGGPSIYAVGNIGPNLPDPLSDNWILFRTVTGVGGNETGALDTAYKRSPWAPLPDSGVAITPESTATLAASLLPVLGAYRRLNCDGTWTTNRDSVDQRAIDHWNNGTGAAVLATEDDVGGFPVLAAGTPCVDTDHDTMPDVWETAKGLNPNSPTDAWEYAANQVYPNVERYWHGLP